MGIKRAPRREQNKGGVLGNLGSPRREQNKGGVLGNLGSPKRETERTNKVKRTNKKLLICQLTILPKLIHFLFILFSQLNIIVSKLN